MVEAADQLLFLLRLFSICLFLPWDRRTLAFSQKPPNKEYRWAYLLLQGLGLLPTPFRNRRQQVHLSEHTRSAFIWVIRKVIYRQLQRKLRGPGIAQPRSPENSHQAEATVEAAPQWSWSSGDHSQTHQFNQNHLSTMIPTASNDVSWINEPLYLHINILFYFKPENERQD